VAPVAGLPCAAIPGAGRARLLTAPGTAAAGRSAGEAHGQRRGIAAPGGQSHRSWDARSPRDCTGGRRVIDRRGAALAVRILLVVGLNIAAVTGLADIAGFHAVYTPLARIRWPWLCAVVAALAMSARGLVTQVV